MTKSINKLQRNLGSNVTYSEAFKRVLEDHLTVIKNDPTTEVVEVNDQVAYSNEGDLIAVLDHYNIPTEHHWLIMRLNDMTSPQEFSVDKSALLIPSRTTFESILNAFRTDQKIAQKRTK